MEPKLIVVFIFSHWEDLDNCPMCTKVAAGFNVTASASRDKKYFLNFLTPSGEEQILFIF